MFNSRQIDIIQRNTYADEFEKVQPTANVQTAENYDYDACEKYDNDLSEKHAFNSKISDNFDKIMHYDVYNKQEEVKERNDAYFKYSKGVNVDIMPSNTTMQFRGLQKTDIYQDYKAEEVYYSSSTQVRAKTKLLICLMAVILTVLSALIILNTTLLNNMNVLISEKTAQVNLLEEQSEEYANRYQEILKENNVL